MSPSIAAAWRISEENWRAISSRIVCDKMKLRQCTSGREMIVSQTISCLYWETLFNARVGSFSSELEKCQWAGVRGSHRVGKINESGVVLLSLVL